MKRAIYDNAVRGLHEMYKAYTTSARVIVRHPLYGPYGREYCSILSPTQALTVSDAKVIRHIGNQACAAGLRTTGGINSLKRAEAISSLSITKGCSKTHEERDTRFLDWLCNRSPYSQCVVTNSGAQAYKMGIILDGNYPSNIVVGCLIAQRAYWEYPQIVSTWNEFVNAGMNESAAFYLAHVYNVSDGNLRKSLRDCHTALSGYYCTDVTLYNYANCIAVESDIFADAQTYKHISSAFGSKGVKIDLKNVAADDGKGGVPNPFANTLILNQNTNVNFHKHMKAIVKYVNGIVKKRGE